MIDKPDYIQSDGLWEYIVSFYPNVYYDGRGMLTTTTTIVDDDNDDVMLVAMAGVDNDVWNTFEKDEELHKKLVEYAILRDI